MKDHIEVTVTLTQKQYQAWNLRNYYSGTRLVLQILLAVLWLVIVVANIILMALWGGFNPLVLLLIVLFPLILLCVPLVLWLHAGRIFRADKFMQARQVYRIDAEGFTVTSQRARAEISWSDVYRVRFHRGLVVIFIAKLRAFLFPLAAFSGEKDSGYFQNLVRSRVPAEKIN